MVDLDPELSLPVTIGSPSQFSRTRLVNGLEVITAEGRVDASVTPEFEAILQEAVAGPSLWVLVDMTAVRYISSSGLKALVTSWRAMRAKGGKLALAGLGPRILEIFNMVGFTQLFPLYASASEAALQFSQETGGEH